MQYVCENCNQARATVHITDTVPEQRERHLCEDCAESEGVIVKHHHTTNAILQEFMKHKAGLGSAGDESCPKCGLTFKEFHASGQLGCPHDYDVFRSLLTPLIERAHENATHHVGKVPVTVDAAWQKQTGLLRLRRELAQAVEEENYELAARVRDQIRLFETAESPDVS